MPTAKRKAAKPTSPAASPKTPQKVQRWIDLLTTLLRHHYPVTFRDLAAGVPAYMIDGTYQNPKPSDTLKRMFERDKADLRDLGVPIQSSGEDGSPEASYGLRSADFYMPYLGVVAQRGLAKPRKVDREGYRALTELAFDADELLAIAEAAARARQLGDPMLRADVDSAVQKLAVDLPLGAASAGDGTFVIKPRIAPAAATFEALSESLFHQKRVTFAYKSMGQSDVARRTAEPYGLFFLNGHWYLVARDANKDALRNFRISRIADVEVNSAKKGTPDYQIPANFSLRDHAGSKNAWELGVDQPLDVLVEIRGDSGAARAAAALGEPVAGSPKRRSYAVRRADVFARWLLSFAGELVPVAPELLVAEFRRQIAATRDVYASGAVR